MFEGLCIDLIDKLANMLGFEYDIYEVADGHYGWSHIDALGHHGGEGMIGELINKKADIALGALTVLPERETVVDFTIPYYNENVGMTILMKKLRHPPNLFKFLDCMEYMVWIYIALAYAITSFLIWVCERFDKENASEVEGEDNQNRIFGFKDCFWFGFTALTQQGSGESPRTLSGWLLATGFWFFAFFCVAIYTANLGAFLTTDRIESTVRNFDDLIRQRKIK